MSLFTLGYEGLSVHNFWEILVAHEIEILVDVRSTPQSRKPGFSKRALTLSADENAIEYQHWGSLGCPRDILQTYRADSDWISYTEKFWRYLRTRENEVMELANLAQQQRCCLLCFEADFNFCHRSYVAEFAHELAPNLQIVHLDKSSQMQPALAF